MVAGTHPRARTIGAIVEDPGYHARLLDYVRRFRARSARRRRRCARSRRCAAIPHFAVAEQHLRHAARLHRLLSHPADRGRRNWCNGCVRWAFSASIHPPFCLDFRRSGGAKDPRQPDFRVEVGPAAARAGRFRGGTVGRRFSPVNRCRCWSRRPRSWPGLGSYGVGTCRHLCRDRRPLPDRSGARRSGVARANPDNLCRGNPCITEHARGRLAMCGRLRRPLAAQSSKVRCAARGACCRVEERGRGSTSAPSDHRSLRPPDRRAGASIKLQATRGIVVRRNIDASARTTPGKIELIAGGNGLAAGAAALPRAVQRFDRRRAGRSRSIPARRADQRGSARAFARTGASMTDLGGEVARSSGRERRPAAEPRPEPADWRQRGGRVSIGRARPGTSRAGAAARCERQCERIRRQRLARRDGMAPSPSTTASTPMDRTQGGAIRLAGGGVRSTAASRLRVGSSTGRGGRPTVTAVSGGDVNLQGVDPRRRAQRRSRSRSRARRPRRVRRLECILAAGSQGARAAPASFPAGRAR